MTTKKTTLRMETLDDRNMLSASPLGEIAAPAQEPTAAHLGYDFVHIQSIGEDYSSERKSVNGQVDLDYATFSISSMGF